MGIHFIEQIDIRHNFKYWVPKVFHFANFIIFKPITMAEGKKRQPKTNDSDDGEDFSQDYDVLQEMQLQMLDNLIMYLSRIRDRVRSAMFFAKATKELRKSIYSFDHYIQEYNLFISIKRLKRPLHFKIDPVAISHDRNNFIQTLDNKYNSKDNKQRHGFFIKLVYQKDSTNYYRMHVELWKQEGKIQSTSQVNLTYQLIEYLKEEGLISGYEGTSVILKSKFLSRMNLNKIKNKEFGIKNLIKRRAESYLNQICSLIDNAQPCMICSKYLSFDVQSCELMPPTFLQYYRDTHCHEECILRQFKEISELMYVDPESIYQRKN